jgi:hypothetical protein
LKSPENAGHILVMVSIFSSVLSFPYSCCRLFLALVRFHGWSTDESQFWFRLVYSIDFILFEARECVIKGSSGLNRWISWMIDIMDE